MDRRLFCARFSVSGEDLFGAVSEDLELNPLPSFEVKSVQVRLNALPLDDFELGCLGGGFFFALLFWLFRALFELTGTFSAGVSSLDVGLCSAICRRSSGGCIGPLSLDKLIT